MESLGELIANMVRAKLHYPAFASSLDTVPYPLVNTDGSLNPDAFGYVNQQLQKIRHFVSLDKKSVSLSEINQDELDSVLECIQDMSERNTYRGERIGVVHPLSSNAVWQYRPGEIVLWEPELNKERIEFFDDYSYKTVTIEAPLTKEWRERNLTKRNLLCTHKCTTSVPKEYVLPLSN